MTDALDDDGEFSIPGRAHYRRAQIASVVENSDCKILGGRSTGEGRKVQR
jgi:hypothetical protein